MSSVQADWIDSLSGASSFGVGGDAQADSTVDSADLREIELAETGLTILVPGLFFSQGMTRLQSMCCSSR